MAGENQKVQGDVRTIFQLDARFHYDNLAEVRRVHDKIVEKGLLQSQLGKNYVRRLEKLLNGTRADTCILCGSALDNSGMVCNGCVLKYKEGKFTADSLASAAAAVSKSGDRKSLMIGAGVLAAAVLLIAVIGLGRIFMFLTIAAACMLAYRAVKKQDKKLPVIAVAVFGVLAIVFSSSGGKDVINAIGMTEAQLEDEFGTPTRDGNYLFFKDEAVYAVMIDGTGKFIGIRNSNKYNILGISVGDKKSRAEKVLEKNNFSREIDSANNNYLIGYKNSQYNLSITYEDEKVSDILVGRAGGR